MSILSTLNKLTGKQDKNVLAALNSLTGKTADDIEEAMGNLGGGGSSSGFASDGYAKAVYASADWGNSSEYYAGKKMSEIGSYGPKFDNVKFGDNLLYIPAVTPREMESGYTCWPKCDDGAYPQFPVGSKLVTEWIWSGDDPTSDPDKFAKWHVAQLSQDDNDTILRIIDEGELEPSETFSEYSEEYETYDYFRRYEIEIPKIGEDCVLFYGYDWTD